MDDPRLAYLIVVVALLVVAFVGLARTTPSDEEMRQFREWKRRRK